MYGAPLTPWLGSGSALAPPPPPPPLPEPPPWLAELLACELEAGLRLWISLSSSRLPRMKFSLANSQRSGSTFLKPCKRNRWDWRVA